MNKHILWMLGILSLFLMKKKLLQEGGGSRYEYVDEKCSKILCQVMISSSTEIKVRIDPVPIIYSDMLPILCASF